MRTVLLSILSFAVISGPTLAQGSVPAAAPLVVEELEKAIREKYPLIESAREEVRAAEGELLSSRGAFDLRLKSRGAWDLESYYPGQTFDTVLEQPTPLWGVSLFGGYRFGRGSFADYDGKLVTSQVGELRAGLQVPLLRDGMTDSRRTKIAKSEVGVQLAATKLHQQLIKATFEGQKRYWDWVAAGGKLRVAQKLLDLAEKRDSQLLLQLKRGDVSKFQVNDNLRGVFRRRNSLAAAERALQSAEIVLSLFLRDELGSPLSVSRERLPESFPALPEVRLSTEAAINTALQEARRRRPDLLELDQKRAQIDQDLRLGQNQMLPALDFNLAVSQDLGAAPPPLARTETEAAIRLEFPLWFRDARGRVQNSRARDAAVAAQARILSDRVKTEIDDAVSALRQARERVSLASEELRLAQELEQGERIRFAQGDSNLIFVQLREETTAEAATRKIDAEKDYWSAEAALNAALGLPAL